MISLGLYLEEMLATLEEDAGRLPRPIAYLLILVISVVIWLPLGLWLMDVAGRFR